MTEELDFAKSLKPVNKIFDEKTGLLSSFTIRSPLISAKRDGKVVPGILYPEDEANNRGFGLYVYPTMNSNNVMGPTEDELYIGLPSEDIGESLDGCCPVTVRYIEGGNAFVVEVHRVISNLMPPQKSGNAIADMNATDRFRLILKVMALLEIKSSGPLKFIHVRRGRGSVYTLTGYSTLQLDGPYDMSIVFHYSDANGNTWTRLASEFLDGRFMKS